MTAALWAGGAFLAGLFALFGRADVALLIAAVLMAPAIIRFALLGPVVLAVLFLVAAVLLGVLR